MYNKEYAQKWIENYESRKDVFRIEHIEPFIKEKILSLPLGSKILDIGCGWGMVADFVRGDQEYYGVDPVNDFFDYIKSKYPMKKLKFFTGSLPSNIPVNEKFDYVVVSMVLHCSGNLSESIKTIFSFVNEGGSVLIIDFANNAETRMRTKTYNPIHKQTKDYISGVATLPSGIKIVSETYFHKEEDYEREIGKYNIFTKKRIGELFVVYETGRKN